MPKKGNPQKLKEIFSKNLNHYMAIKGVNTADLSRDLSYSFTTVSDWVHGRKYPRMEKVQILADYFGVAMSSLTEEPSPSGQTKEQILACELFSQCYGKEAFSAVSKFLRLDEVDRARVVERIDTLLDSEKYKPVSKGKTATAV